MEPLGTPSGLLEPSRTRLGASGTGFSLWNARSAWNARKALLRSSYCSLAGDIISVLHPLRPPSAAPHPLERPLANGPPSGLLEQPQATGTAFGLGPPAGLIAATRLRVCDGNAMNVR